MTTHVLRLPVDAAQIETLRIGDAVYLDGIIYTARDMAHLQIKTLRSEGKPLPVDFSGRAIFHAGPVVRKTSDGWDMAVIGPTSSIRMEPYAEMVGELGVRLIIGKGGLADGSRAMFRKYRQAYLQAAPGCAVLLATGVKKVVDGFWPEHGMPETLWVLDVERFGPFVATMDADGNSRYDEVEKAAREKADALCK